MADPQAFDTGLSVPQRTLLRREIVDALAPLTKAGGRYLFAVKPISCVVTGPNDEAGIAELHKALDAGSPMVGVSLSRAPFTPSGEGALRNHWTKTVEVNVYVHSDNAGSVLARIEQDAISTADHTKDPGIEVILEHVHELLAGFQADDPSNTIHQLVPELEEEIWHDDQRTVWRILYSVMIEAETNAHRDITQRVTLIHTEHRDQVAETSDEAPLVVAAWNSSTLQLQFATPRPGGLAIGDRLVVKHADGTLDPGKVILLVSTDKVTIDEDFVAPPVAGELVYLTTNPLVSETSLS